MAYSSSFRDPLWDNSAPNEGLSTTSWDRLSATQRLSEDDIAYGRSSPLPDDTSTRSLIHQTSNASINPRNTEYSSGRYHAIDHIGEEPTRNRGEGLSFGLSRLRRGLPGTSTQRSHQSSVFAGQLAVGKAGWWTRQMLVDRSLRSMAALMTVFAFALIIIVITYAPRFSKRPNKHSTSVGSPEPESCGEMEARNIIIHLIINISATMVLGMSNTYQQLVTALNVDEIRSVLVKKGDSRVGTNSPFAINDKPTGKLKHWLAWVLLITTSLPVHFLANSLVGPSLYVEPPSTTVFHPTNNNLALSGSYGDFACWAAFRTGQYHFPKDTYDMSSIDAFSLSITYTTVNITYTSNCTQYAKKVSSTTDISQFANEILPARYSEIGIGDCQLYAGVECEFLDPQLPKCRLNVRYQAALILAGCLTIKAIYMIAVNLRARKKVKKHCLTFGDVIVASALDPNLQVKNECLVSAGDAYRRQVHHTCHKHCKDPVPSATGDEIGHCQKAKKCKKYNVVDKSPNLVTPVLALKYKKSLIANLGSTAVSQMIILMFASLFMLGFSLTFAVQMGLAGSYFDEQCHLPIGRQQQNNFEQNCELGRTAYLQSQYGSWGGFNSSIVLSELPADSLTSEQIAFWVSNGAQLIYSLLYLLLIYNITLISMEYDWGKFEMTRQRLRCTIVRGDVFEQSYLLQLPKKVLFPLMGFSALMHWLLGQAISTRETIWHDSVAHTEHSRYEVVTAAYPVFLSTTLMIGMTTLCWWAFTFKREGFMPQMYGSIRACSSATTELDDFTTEGVQWGDLGNGEKFRHAGFSSREIGKMVPAELYCGGKGSREREKSKGD